MLAPLKVLTPDSVKSPGPDLVNSTPESLNSPASIVTFAGTEGSGAVSVMSDVKAIVVSMPAALLIALASSAWVSTLIVSAKAESASDEAPVPSSAISARREVDVESRVRRPAPVSTTERAAETRAKNDPDRHACPQFLAPFCFLTRSLPSLHETVILPCPKV